jgi:hypothetical protein
VYQDYSGSAPLLRAAVHANGAWASGPPIPGGFASFLPKIGGAPTGQALLGIPVEGDGVYVTWLRP